MSQVGARDIPNPHDVYRILGVVTIPCDVDGDLNVDPYHTVKLLVAYSVRKGQPEYDPNLDINGKGQIYLYDAVILCIHHGQKDL